MGIVAFCPNGHRVKVKDDLAGRKGICPTCAARFRIPQPDRSRSVADPAGGIGVGPPSARVLSLDPVYAASLPAAHALDEHDAGSAIAEFPEPTGDRSEVDPPEWSVGDHDVPDEASSAEEVRVYAALDERPDLAWCVAVRGGAPSAPLDAAAMRAWLDGGIASAEHVVWRADWPEWRPLDEVFPDALTPPSRWP